MFSLTPLDPLRQIVKFELLATNTDYANTVFDIRNRFRSHPVDNHNCTANTSQRETELLYTPWVSKLFVRRAEFEKMLQPRAAHSHY